MSTPELQLHFLMQLLQATKTSQGNPQALHSLLQKNLDKLDDSLIEVLKNWTDEFIPPLEQALITASTISDFALLLQQCPFGERETNIEIAVTACQQALKVFRPGIIPQRRAAIQTLQNSGQKPSST